MQSDKSTYKVSIQNSSFRGKLPQANNVANKTLHKNTLLTLACRNGDAGTKRHQRGIIRMLYRREGNRSITAHFS